MGNSTGIKAGRAYVELGVDDKITAGLKRAQKQLRAFGAGVRSIGASIVKSVAIPAGGFLISAKIFGEFDDRMRVVQAVTGATQDQFQKLREEAKRLGAETSFSARQVADAMAELGRAGFTPDAILGSTEAVLALSRATDTELARATEIAGASLRGFNLEVSDMSRVTDVLTATANGSAQTLDDLFEALKPVAPIAAEAGESIEQTAAAIAVLANNGIKGSLAGNSLARAYKNLADETKQGKLREFGVEAVDAAGNLRPLSSIINDLAKSTAGLGTAKRLSIFETLFGRGQASALKLASSGEAFADLANTITNSAGAAKTAADQMDAGIGGSFRRLASAVEAIAIAIGESIKGPLKTATDGFAKLAGVVRFYIDNNRRIVAVTLVVVGALGAIGVALIGVGLFFTIASAAVGGIVAAFGALVTAAGLVASPIVIASGALAAFIAVLVTKTSIGANAIAFLGRTFAKLAALAGPTFKAIGDAITNGDLKLGVEIAGKGMEVAWALTMTSMRTMWIEFVAFIQKSISKIPNAINGLVLGTEIALGALWNYNNPAEFIGKGPRLPDTSGLGGVIDTAAQNQIDDLNSSLADLITELATLTKAAGENSAGGKSPVFGKIENIAKLLGESVAGIEAGGRTSSRGTFNASALAGFGAASNEASRTAVATETTATNTHKMLKSIREIPGQARFA